jgi:hypothetical protein
MVGAKVFDLLFRTRRSKAGGTLGPVARLARTPMGRFAIVEALQAFYETDGVRGDI